MRRLIVNIYRIVFKLSSNKPLALVSALIYIAILNLVVIYGLSLLLEGLFHEMAWVVKLFSFPYYIITAIVIMVLINLCLMLPLRKLSKYAKRRFSLLPLIVYSFSTLLLLLYAHFRDSIF